MRDFIRVLPLTLIMRPPIKWRIEGMDKETGEWRLHNYFKGSANQAKDKASEVLLKTHYHGIRIKEDV